MDKINLKIRVFLIVFFSLLGGFLLVYGITVEPSGEVHHSVIWTCGMILLFDAALAGLSEFVVEIIRLIKNK